MSLVAYESSDSEEDSKVEVDPKSEIIVTLKQEKPRKTVQITIPSLDEFKDEDVKEPERKKQKLIKGGSGLFSLLPPPKNSVTTSSFKPHILTKAKKPSKVPPRQQPTGKEASSPTKTSHVPGQKTSTSTSEQVDTGSDEEDSVEKSDFFSLDVPKPVLPMLTDDFAMPSTSTSLLFKSLPEPVQNAEISSSISEVRERTIAQSEAQLETNYYQSADHSGSNDAVGGSYIPTEDMSYSHPDSSGSGLPSQVSVIQNEAFRRIKGRKETENIDFIDISADEQMTGKDQWLMRSLTEEKVQRPSRKRHDMPTQQQRRKHQITYLAFQAKERELDLKNQWAANSRTRRETQAKYGF